MARRTVTAAVSVILVTAAALATGYAVTTKPRAAGGTGSVPTTTAAVTRGTVSERIQLPGTYGFDGAYTVVHQGPPGILTGAAQPGARVSRGGILYTVDGQPVRLLYGSVPAYRELRAGVTPGSDVRQLEQNLVALGMDPRRQMTVDGRFTATTAAAIRRWQASWGLAPGQRTGALALGRVVFLPVALRVSQVPAAIGAAIGPNQPVLTATSTTRVVTAQIAADRRGSIEVGDQVMVSLLVDASIPGRVERIGRVAEAPATTDEGGPPEPATVTVVVRLTATARIGDLDQAPVQISIAAATREDVLLVPVTALLARPGGGYRVRLSSGEYVQVEPGLFDDATGKVEVSGELNEGDRVEVPVP